MKRTFNSASKNAFNDSVKDIITETIRETDEYLKKLKVRVLDNSSKVLITGDLNSGKSTLINAILHQNILPTDQQPCTQSFCEIIPVEEGRVKNKIVAYKSTTLDHDSVEGVEIGQESMREELQNDESEYKWFKIFISAPRYMNFAQDQITISFIDSPGLNTDLFKTTSLFNQQQDIDVVVFVVNASFHLTLSGREFLEQAAKEKEQIFFVVNKFDEIENIKKCQKLITKQINEILPGTIDDAQSLIHFVSAKQYLMECNDEDTVPSNEIALNTDEVTQKRSYSKSKCDFDEMKQSLLNFLYLKRSISKLSPVKTYSTKLLQDLNELTKFNLVHIESEISSFKKKIDSYSQTVKLQEGDESQLRTKLNAVASKASETCYNQTYLIASSFYDHISKVIQIDKYSGIWKMQRTIQDNYEKISHQYSKTITEVEQKTNQLKLKGLGDLDSLSELYGIAHGSDSTVLQHNEFILYSSMPLHKPSILELFNPRDLLINFGTFNLTSMVGAVVGFQPCVNLAWKFARRIGLNPLVLSTLMIGSLGKLHIIDRNISNFLGIFVIIKASSSIERSVLTKLENYFTSRFNKEIWASDLADRCRQSVCSTLTSRSSQIFVKYQQILENNRQDLAEISEKSELLSVNRDHVNGLNKRIEFLLHSCSKINL